MMRVRRGSALILVLMMTLAIAGLSIAAIFMSSSAGLLSAFYDREREYRLVAESGLELARSRLMRDTALAIPDTGMRQLIAGAQVRDAYGVALPQARVNVYASVTGDTTGGFLPFVTLIAAAYDSRGTRHVRRLDLRRESFSSYAIVADAFPSGRLHGPGVVAGRVHTNETWRGTSSGNIYSDTVTAVTAITGVGAFDADTIVGVVPIRYPRDSTYLRLDSLAAAANLSFAPVSGGGRGSRLEFVSFDADGSGVVDPREGFVRVFDLAAAAFVDTTRLRASPPYNWGVAFPAFEFYLFHNWNDRVIQNQCGAFYLRGGRWHFFPVATHRALWARSVIQSTSGGSYPQVSATQMGVMDDFTSDAVYVVLRDQPTARCFPAGSPFLMPTERKTDASGAVTGTAADSVPFGVITPASGWPLSAPSGYGGGDTTFTVRSRTCTISSASTSGRCDNGTLTDLGAWRAFGGTAVGGISTAVRQSVESPYLWPISSDYNANARGVVSATAGPLYVSGVVRGRVTLRVAGRASVVDRIRYQADPGDPAVEACENQLGVLAVGDVLVAAGLMSRVRRIARADVPPFIDTHQSVVLGGETRFTIHGSLMSTTGTVGVENSGVTMGDASDQFPCPTNGGIGSNSNGGCLWIVGGRAMRTFSSLHSGGGTNGFRYGGAADRCQSTTRRPPFFPLTNRYTFVRTLEIEPSRANTPAKIRALLMSLKGKSL